MKALERYLKRRKESQAAFARRIGVSQAAVSLWLSGSRQPETDSLKLLAATTGLSMDELLGMPIRRAQRRGRAEAAA